MPQEDNKHEFLEYEYLKACEYGVYSKYDPYNNYTSECGKPAVAVVWWKGKDKDALYLCEEHFEYVLECEEKEGE